MSRGLKQNLIGKRFGKLIVVSEDGRKNNNVLWKCICDCGGTNTVSSCSLNSGNTKSCGCFNGMNKTRQKSLDKFGCYTTSLKEYPIWRSMIKRCSYKKAINYHRYGGRGIKVCDRWQEFENFLEDMGERPSNKHSIDRIDNDGNYCPENCRWATQKEQMNNTSLTIKYKDETLGEAAKRIGITRTALHLRIRRWGIKRAFETKKLI